MSSDSTYLQMFSTLTAEGELRLELKEQPMPIPGENEVLIRIEATPINPSDHGVIRPSHGPLEVLCSSQTPALEHLVQPDTVADLAIKNA